MSNNPEVGKVINLTGGNGGDGSLKLEGLRITKGPLKTTYKSGQSFDPTGMVVTALYAYGLTSDVTGYTVTPAVLTDGVGQVTITYTEGRITKTASVNVTVEKVLTSISVTTPPTKTTYNYLERFVSTGMGVTAQFSDGSSAPATSFTCSDTPFSTLGSAQVDVSYTYEGVTKQTTVPVTVNAIQVSVPSQKNIPTYDGTQKTAEWDNYDSVKMGLTGDVNGVNAKTNYAAVFTLIYGYVFPDGENEVTVNWTIKRDVIAAVPQQVNVPAADGGLKTPSWDSYDPVKMTMGGDLSGTNAGDYSSTFTPTANYEWWDGTTAAKSASWSIASVIVTVPTQKNVPTYDGSSKTPEWNNFDEENSTIQVTSKTDAGEYEATFSLLQGMWDDGTTAPQTVKWHINRAPIAAVPEQSGTLTYDGNPHTPTWDNKYFPAKMNVSVEAKTLAGNNYSAGFTPTANYEWWDGSTTEKTATWAIDKADPTVTAPTKKTPTYDGSSKALLNGGSTTGGTLKYSADGTNYSTDIPEATNAGTYTVYYKVVGDNNYNDVAADSIEVTIAQATGTLTGLPSKVTLKTDHLTENFTIGGDFDGTYEVTSKDTSVASVSNVSGKTYQISHVNKTTGNTKVVVTPKGGSNYSAPDPVEITVSAEFVTIWGVEWDWTGQSKPTKGKRTDAAKDFGDPNPAVNNGTGSSPFDNIGPWKDMIRETHTCGVMVKEPKYWFKWTRSAANKLKLQIANGPVEGFQVDPVNRDRGDGERQYSYVGRYHCAADTNDTSNEWKSLTNKAQKCSITRSAARTGIAGLGTKLSLPLYQFDFAQMWYIGMLFLVEFADWNGQATIGYGCSASGSKENNGKTDAMQYHTGTTAANRTTYGYTQYRNIEGYWDNVYDWMDGCYYTSSGLNVINNPANYSDSANGTLVGKPTSGYPSDLAIPTAAGYEWAVYPCEKSGSQTTCVPDGWYFNGGCPCLRHGGNYYQYLYHGPFYVDYNGTDDSSGNVGCRLWERGPKVA